jgi:hypothetical protein
MTSNSEEHHHQHNSSARGEMREAPTFSKKYPHENRLRNQHLSTAEAPQKNRRTKTREVKTGRDQPLIVADKKSENREKSRPEELQ